MSRCITSLPIVTAMKSERISINWYVVYCGIYDFWEVFFNIIDADVLLDKILRWYHICTFYFHAGTNSLRCGVTSIVFHRPICVYICNSTYLNNTSCLCLQRMILTLKTWHKKTFDVRRHLTHKGIWHKQTFDIRRHLV